MKLRCEKREGWLSLQGNNDAVRLTGIPVGERSLYWQLIGDFFYWKSEQPAPTGGK